MTKELKEKAIDIKGKEYVLVSDRVIYFNETYPTGAIETQLISEPNAEMVVIKAIVIPDISQPQRRFTGYSQATWGDGYINKTSALENCETSAVGRALSFMGIGVIYSIASVDEINKANSTTSKKQNDYQQSDKKASAKQVKLINTLLTKKGRHRDALKNHYGVESLKDLDVYQASDAIERLNSYPEASLK